MRISRAAVLLLAALWLATAAAAQGRRTVTVTADAPVFVTPNSTQRPLLVAPSGAVLGLLDVDGDWCHVEFEDVQFGRRVGYIETRHVRINAPSSTTNAPATPGAGQAAPPPPIRATPQPPPPPPLPQRGDVAIGYVFMHEDGLSLSSGIAGSGAWRVHPLLDILGEAQYVHGTSDLVTPDGTVDLWTVLAGPRVWSSGRYGARVRGFVQGLVGVLTAKGTSLAATTSASGLAVQPGFGAEIQASRQVAIRPEFDLLFGRIEGQRTTDTRFHVALVYRLLR